MYLGQNPDQADEYILLARDMYIRLYTKLKRNVHTFYKIKSFNQKTK